MPFVQILVWPHKQKELLRLAKRAFKYLAEHLKGDTSVPKLSEIKGMLGEEVGEHFQRAFDAGYLSNSNICRAAQFNRIGNIVIGARKSATYCRQFAEVQELLNKLGDTT